MSVRIRRVLSLAAVAASASLLVSACAGGAASEDGTGRGGAGFDYGADQEEVDAALADLDPVEITYQAGAQSPNSVTSVSDFTFKEYIEERSGGKITVDIVWGQAIAGYPEIEDALVDGRIDVSFAVPIYKPNEYPAFDALATTTSGLPNSPVVGEMVGNASVIDLAWSSEELLAEYEAQGVTPLLPMISSGTYLTVCAEPGTAPEDWKGRQVRVASIAHEAQARNLGGSPVSMEYVEVFEALQRGTVDCTVAQMLPSEEGGILEVAPYVSYTSEENSLSGRAAGATLAGTKYQQLPLAYQQIIFDAGQGAFAASSQANAEGNAAGVRQLKGAGGEIGPLDPESDEMLGQTNQELIAGVEESGVIGTGIADRTAEIGSKWSAAAEELGYADEGGFEDVDEWFSPEKYDFTPMAERVFEEVMLPHRPS